MNIVNDKSCSWVNDLTPRINTKSIKKDYESDWLIIGAGYTGLSAARKLSELHTGQKIIIVDAQLAGEGASGRNSHCMYQLGSKKLVMKLKKAT